MMLQKSTKMHVTLYNKSLFLASEKKSSWVFLLHPNQWFRHIDFFWTNGFSLSPTGSLVLSLLVNREREYGEDTLLILASVQAWHTSLLAPVC